MRGDADQDVGEVGDDVDLGQTAGLDERLDYCCRATAAHATGEEPVAASDRDWANGALAGVVVDRDAPVFEELPQRPVLIAEVADGFGHGP